MSLFGLSRADRLHSRRELLGLSARGLAAGALGVSLPNLLFMRQALGVTRQEAPYDAVIQIFLEGGASQLDTWSPKPGSPNTVFQALAIPGTLDTTRGGPVLVSEALRELATLVGSDPGAYGLGKIDSMVTITAAHEAAQSWCNCFTEGGLADQRPSFLAVAAYLLQQEVSHGLPAVLVHGRTGLAANEAKNCPIPAALTAWPDQDMAGLLRPPVSPARYARRRELIEALAGPFLARRPDAVGAAWSEAVSQAYEMTVKGEAARAFDLSGVELLPGKERGFARQLTLAQQLVSAGVPVVGLGLGGHDLHENLRAGILNVWRDTIDPAVAQMARNLAARGKRVLVSFVTEFGRSPKLAGSDGRDHWAGGYTHALLSIGQPRFRSGVWGDTGPDGEWTVGKRIQQQVRLGPYGAFLWRALGIDVDDPANFIPQVDGSKKPAVWSRYFTDSSDLYRHFLP